MLILQKYKQKKKNVTLIFLFSSTNHVPLKYHVINYTKTINLQRELIQFVNYCTCQKLETKTENKTKIPYNHRWRGSIKVDIVLGIHIIDMMCVCVCENYFVIYTNYIYIFLN